jgi:hypothetical protein
MNDSNIPDQAPSALELELPDTLAPADLARVTAAAMAAVDLELIRIEAERDRAVHVRLVSHTPEKIPDEKGGTRDVLTACPDCTRGLLGWEVTHGRTVVPVRICSTLLAPQFDERTLTWRQAALLPDKLAAKATAHDVFACGLDPQGAPVKVG